MVVQCAALGGSAREPATLASLAGSIMDAISAHRWSAKPSKKKKNKGKGQDDGAADVPTPIQGLGPQGRSLKSPKVRFRTIGAAVAVAMAAC